MIQRIAPLFTVEANHGYYAGNCEDFAFFVPTSTQRIMQGGQLAVRDRAGRMCLFYAAESPGVPKQDLTGRTLLFGLRLINHSFSNYTEAVVNDAGRTPFYFNGADPKKLDPPQGVLLTSGVHGFSPQTATRPLMLSLSDHDGNLLASQMLPVGADNGSFDLRTLPDGRYQIDEDTGDGSIAFTPLFLGGELLRAGVWGLLAIRIETDFYTAPPVFELNFSARQEQLKYFVVAKNFNPTEFDQLNITDVGFNDAGRPQLDFDRVLPGSFSSADIPPGLLSDSESRIVMFRSQVKVARHDQPLRKLQLNRNGDVLISNLPMPGADKPQAHFIIHLSKP